MRKAGKSNVKRLMDTYSADEVVQYMNFQKEEAFLLCDQATRRTRRLVKVATRELRTLWWLCGCVALPRSSLTLLSDFPL